MAPAAGGDALFAGAMPKEEIGALRFLQKHPEYDGRGVIIAIFDTGVDPGAPGLQVTSDGKPKIIDVVDCTGSGDVDTSKVVKADDDGCITGASGRKLRLNPAWANPSGEWRVGSKRLFDLVPRPLVGRLKEERKKRFEELQRAALAAASSALAAAPPNGKPAPAPAAAADGAGGGEEGAAGGAQAAEGGGAAAAGAQVAAGPKRSELEARVAYLQDMMKAFDDPGPVVDAVVWHDGATWRAALDTADVHAAWAGGAGAGGGGGEQGGAGKGALAEHPPFADYRLERQWAPFSALDSCNYCLNVYDGGGTLSVVVDSGAHGTHVAGIAAACFPEDPASSGVAPGAQIISCKIGDTRLGSMETGTALARAAVAVIRAGAHVINMSFGEPGAVPNQGRVVDVVSELVNRHGVIYVASAGNAGPALSTVGAPGGTSSALISVGAFVSPPLAAAGHSLRALGELGDAGQQYTWSSRGPAADGDPGVTLSAPGGAIASVPQWTTQRRQLMNGTSMASPNACGGIALVLSALLARGEAVSPPRVRRALENTCEPLGDAAGDGVLTYGRGMLQVDKAFDYLAKSADVDAPATRYTVTITGGGPPGVPDPRGIYLREPHESLAPRSFTVGVKPTLHEDAPTSDKLLIEDSVRLRSTAGWVSCPELLLLHHNGRSFEAKVDPTQLPEGLHYAEVQGFDSRAEWRGPLFRVPITVIRPARLPEAPPPPAPAASATAAGPAAAPGVTPAPDGGPLAAGGSGGEGGGSAAAAPYTLKLGPLPLSAGAELRRFVAVPPGATWAEATFRAGEYDTPKLFLIRAAQLAPGSRYTWSEWRSNLTLAPTSEYSANFRVIGGATLELTLAQFWSSLGATSLDVEISFHGLQVDGALGGRHGAAGAELALAGGAGAARFTVASPLRRQRLKPEAKVDALCIPLRPSEASIEPLEGPEGAAGDKATPLRDTLPVGRVAYRLLLTYKLKAEEAGKYKPTVPLLNNTLYECPLESQMLMLFDSNKRLVYTGDAYPEGVQLPKGDYTLRLWLRHESRELLDKLKGTCVVVERAIDPAVALPVHASHAAAVSGGAAAGELFLGAGERLALWLGAPAEDKVPKDAKEGRIMKGRLTLGQLRRGTGAAPAKHAVRYVVPPPVNKDADKGGAKKKEEPEAKDAATKVAEGLRDAKLALMKDLRGEADAEAYDSLAAELRGAFPKHLPLLLELLRRAEAAPKDKDGAARRARVVAAADDVIDAVDATALAAFLALRAPDDDENDSGGAVAGGPAGGAGAPGYKAQKKGMDEAKAALLEAMKTKLEAQLDEADEGGAAGEAAAAAALQTSAELRRWVDTGADAAYVLLHSRVEERAGRLVGALKALDRSEKAAEDEGKPPSKAASERRAALLEALGWRHWSAYERARAALRFPDSFPPF